MNIIALDTETTGMSATDDIVEFAWAELDSDLNIVRRDASLIKPPCAISPGAAGVHGITMDKLVDAPTMHQYFDKADHPFDSEQILMVAHNCLTGDHEVRTRDGWRRFDSIAGSNIEIAQWSTNGEIKFVDAKMLRSEYSGDMLEWDTSYHKGVYTPNHRIFYKTSRKLNGDWCVVDAKSFSEKACNSLHIPVSGVFVSENQIDITPDEARFIEMCRADGNIMVAKCGTLSVRLKFKKVSKIDRCTQILSKLNFEYSIRFDKLNAVTFRLKKSERVEHLLNLLMSSGTKSYGLWLIDLPVSAREALLDELQHWDGHAKPGNMRQTKLSTISLDTVDAIMDAATFTNKCAKSRTNIPNTRGFSRADGVIHEVSVRDRNTVKTLSKPKTAHFSGVVYCATVPSGAFLVRRNGATWVTGNSPFDARFIGKYVEITASLCTLKLARKIYTDSPDHKLATLKYYLDLEADGAFHSAAGDVTVLVSLIRRMSQDTNLDLFGLYDLANEPTLITKMPFGKHKGVALKELPPSYVKWLFELPNLQDDLRYSLERI
jgi:DNA polymerase III epsilon subunit-like protein